MAVHPANRGASSGYLNALSRPPEGHGFWTTGRVGEVTPSSGLTLNINRIPVRECLVNGAALSDLSATTVTLDAADATNPRRDTIFVNTAGTIAASKGTAAASPFPNNLSSTQLALAEVYVAANATSIVAGNITDRRQRMAHARLIQKDTSQNVNDSSFTDDNIFAFYMDIAGRVQVKLFLQTSLPTADGFKYRFATAPALGAVTAALSSAYSVCDFRGAGSTNQYTVAGAATGGGVVVTTPGFTGDSVVIDALLVGGGTGVAGDIMKVTFQWAEQTDAGGTSTVSGGTGSSFMMIQRVF